MQVTKGTWRMREQCVPGFLSPPPTHESLGTRLCLSLLVITFTKLYDKRTRTPGIKL